MILILLSYFDLSSKIVALPLSAGRMTIVPSLLNALRSSGDRLLWGGFAFFDMPTMLFLASGVLTFLNPSSIDATIFLTGIFVGAGAYFKPSARTSLSCL